MTREEQLMERHWAFLTDTQKRDTDSSIMPWYTFGALDWIKKNITNDVYVLEFGGGHSTLWWRKRASHVHTIEFDPKACEILNIPVSSPLQYFKDYEVKQVYDVVIVDSEAEISRQEYILKAFELSKKYFIVDNFQQPDVCLYSKEVVEFLFNNTKEQYIFNQPQHRDGTWQTAIFVK